MNAWADAHTTAHKPAHTTQSPCAASDHGAVASANNRQSFEEFYSDSYPRMLRLAVALLPARQAAEDVVQDAYLQCYARFPFLDTPEAYVRRSVVNMATGFFRRRGMAGRRMQLLVQPEYHPEHDTMLAVLDALPPRQQAAIVLRFYEQCTEAEIAAALRCRPGTVKSLLSRGIAALREVLQHD